MSMNYRVTRTAIKDPDEAMPVKLNWFKFCFNSWEPNELYMQGEIVRPEMGTGFAYQAAGDGTTGSRRPRWPLTIGQTVTDGSIVWTCLTGDTNGINPIESPSAFSEPAGLTIGSLAVEESYKLLATYSGGVIDTDYAAVFTVILNGLPRVARQLVQIRKR
jgi:hypothetical protein